MSCNFNQRELKTIVVDPYTPVFQKSGITYNDEAFNAFVTYDDMKPKTLEEFVAILSDIERKFEFRVYNANSITCDPYEFKIYMILGNLKLIKITRRSYQDNYIGLFKIIFDGFMELLGAYVDLLGDKPKITRESNNYDQYNRILFDYLNSKVREEKVTVTYKGTQFSMPRPNQTPLVKPKRLYGLDGLDIDDSVYNKVISWIESRRDFILIDYNNMSEIC